MNDYISRRAAIAILDRWLSVKGYSEGEINVMRCMRCELENIPPAEAQPVRHGHWIKSRDPITGAHNDKCSVFGQGFYTAFGFTPNYCCIYGARMDEGSENDE